MTQCDKVAHIDRLAMQLKTAYSEFDQQKFMQF